MTQARLKKHLTAQRFVALGFLSVIFLCLIGAQKSSVAALLQRGERVPVLIFGTDTADLSQHTDTLMVAVFNPIKNLLHILSIPRDTYIDLPGYRFRRVNEIYGYHLRKTQNPLSSSEKVLEGIGHALSSGHQKVSVPYFVQVDYNGFRKIIDLLGGVWITVQQPMDYDDNAGNYHFHRQPGRYLMKGEEALLYIRFRGLAGDRGRIFRQQEFLRNALFRLANPLALVRIPHILVATFSSLRTNLSFWDGLYLISAARRVRPANLGFSILPGSPKGHYWRLKDETTEPLLATLFFGERDEKPRKGASALDKKITVKVWNASGKKGLGYRVTKYLRRCGYDVLDWGNYEADQIQTRVIDRKGKIEQAQAIANDLGVENFHSEPSDSALVDVEVVVGQNYNGLASMGF